MNFSVVVIAKNEEKTLPRLLDSLKEFQQEGGEVIVLDTGSTDNTKKIAEERGCIVREKNFSLTITEHMAKEINDKFVQDDKPIVEAGQKVFDFARARNYASSLASNDMVAMPDADEEYTMLQLPTLNRLIADGAQQFEYNFVFAHDEFGNETIKFFHSKFYNRKVLHWDGVVHEILKGDAQRIHLNEDVIKLEHWQNHETDRKGYLAGLALDCHLHPDKDRNSHYFARDLMYHKYYKSAIAEFKRHLTISEWKQERGQSMIYIGNCYNYLGEEEKALKWWNKAIAEDCTRREPWVALANYYYQKGDHQRVCCYASAMEEIPWNGFYSNRRDYYTIYPDELQYWAKWYLDNKDEAKRHFQKCIKYNPEHPKYLHDLQFFN